MINTLLCCCKTCLFKLNVFTNVALRVLARVWTYQLSTFRKSNYQLLVIFLLTKLAFNVILLLLSQVSHHSLKSQYIQETFAFIHKVLWVKVLFFLLYVSSFLLGICSCFVLEAHLARLTSDPISKTWLSSLCSQQTPLSSFTDSLQSPERGFS